jgi:hypothetical protein
MNWLLTCVLAQIFIKCGRPAIERNVGVSVRSTVLSEIETVAAEQAKKLAPLRDDLLLTESGLDSLCLALVVVKLEDRLGCDPFSESEGAEFPVTLGEFVRLYEDAAH